MHLKTLGLGVVAHANAGEDDEDRQTPELVGQLV